MNTRKLFATVVVAGLSINSNGYAQEPVTAEVFKAIEVEVATEAGFDYQFMSSTDLINFTPTGTDIPGNNGTQSMFFRQEEPMKFFRVERTPSSLDRIIQGLLTLSFDTANTVSIQNGLRITGARAQSAKFDRDDYLNIDYTLNLKTQCIEPSSIQAFENVGPTTSGFPLFFLADRATSFEVSQDGTPVAYNSIETLTIPAAGSTLTASLNINHVMGWITDETSDAFELTVRDPDGGILSKDILSQSTQRYFHSPVRAFKAGDYTIVLLPRSGSPATLKLQYRNTNQQETGVLSRPNGSASASVDLYHFSYQKFRIQLNEGETFATTTDLNDASLAIYDSNGKRQGGRGSTSTITWNFLAPKTDNYWLVYYHDVYAAKSSTIDYSISVPSN